MRRACHALQARAFRGRGLLEGIERGQLRSRRGAGLRQRALGIGPLPAGVMDAVLEAAQLGMKAGEFRLLYVSLREPQIEHAAEGEEAFHELSVAVVSYQLSAISCQLSAIGDRPLGFRAES